MSFFGEMLKKGIRKPLEYPSKTKKYLDEKALANRASRYERNAINNGFRLDEADLDEIVRRCLANCLE